MELCSSTPGGWDWGPRDVGDLHHWGAGGAAGLLQREESEIQ